MPERSADWIGQAERDIKNAEWELEGKYYEWGCFVSQQAAEKALKSVYQKLAGDAWGHSTRELLVGLKDKISVSDELVKYASYLDKFYIPSRYPNGWPNGKPGDYITEEETKNAISYSKKIIAFCKDILAKR
ncbi:HEPN domain-containing protein [Chlamydiota bacterium]